MDDKLITEAVHASIAKSVLESLDTEVRDAILQKSIVEAIGDFRFRSRVDEVVAEKAGRVVSELVEPEEWSARITAAIQAGFEDYLKNLRQAIPGVLGLALHGKEGDYDRRTAAILRCWPRSDS